MLICNIILYTDEIYLNFYYVYLFSPICSLSVVEEGFDNSKISCVKVTNKIYKNYDTYRGRQDQIELVDTFSSRNIIAAIEPNCFYCLY